MPARVQVPTMASKEAAVQISGCKSDSTCAATLLSRVACPSEFEKNSPSSENFSSLDLQQKDLPGFQKRHITATERLTHALSLLSTKPRLEAAADENFIPLHMIFNRAHTVVGLLCLDVQYFSQGQVKKTPRPLLTWRPTFGDQNYNTATLARVRPKCSLSWQLSDSLWRIRTVHYTCISQMRERVCGFSDSLNGPCSHKEKGN